MFIMITVDVKHHVSLSATHNLLFKTMSGSKDPLAVDEGTTAQVLAVVTERHLHTTVKSWCGREDDDDEVELHVLGRRLTY